ncbi:MAG: hypothetical protein KF802_12575 [Bdellovibrionaceae bacterium]|nr:hypothetical protein [Pseudobdellovibrionaceae bacterium]MBX3034700.1 hypothetical protein [Pseudobdellovibrionaceae bacterium]
MKNKLLDQWLSLPEKELLCVLKWTPESLLLRILEEDSGGRLKNRLREVLPPGRFEALTKRAFAARLARHRKAA